MDEAIRQASEAKRATNKAAEVTQEIVRQGRDVEMICVEAMFGMVDTVVGIWPQGESGSTADDPVSDGAQECMQIIMDDAAESMVESYQMAAAILEETITAVVQGGSTEMKGEALVRQAIAHVRAQRAVEKDRRFQWSGDSMGDAAERNRQLKIATMGSGGGDSKQGALPRKLIRDERSSARGALKEATATNNKEATDKDREAEEEETAYPKKTDFKEKTYFKEIFRFLLSVP